MWVLRGFQLPVLVVPAQWPPPPPPPFIAEEFPVLATPGQWAELEQEKKNPPLEVIIPARTRIEKIVLRMSLIANHSKDRKRFWNWDFWIGDYCRRRIVPRVQIVVGNCQVSVDTLRTFHSAGVSHAPMSFKYFTAPSAFHSTSGHGPGLQISFAKLSGSGAFLFPGQSKWATPPL